MSRPLTDVRFPQAPPPGGLELRLKRRSHPDLFERLIRIIMLNENMTRQEAIARVRSEYPWLAKEAAMTTEYAEFTKAEIEEEVVARTRHYILEQKLDPEKDYRQAHHAVLADDPALKVAYFEGDVVGTAVIAPLAPGPKVQGPAGRGRGGA